MLFTRNNQQITSQPITPSIYNSNGPFSSRYLRSHPGVNNTAINSQTRFTPNTTHHTRYLTNSQFTPNPQRATPAVDTSTQSAKKMKWGKPTWVLFHVMAEKIKPEYYAAYCGEILDIIKMICNTLPCPICANHASSHMKNITLVNIRTKQDLQNLLWEFHNIVNQRKGFPQFPFNELTPQYSALNTRSSILNFIKAHSDKTTGFRLIADNFYRSNVTKILQTWFTKHIAIFDE
jgi:hypothetical protein